MQPNKRCWRWIRKRGLECPSEAELLCCSLTPSPSVSPLGLEGISWEKEGWLFHTLGEKRHTKRDREGEENNIRWWPGLTSCSHQWESSDELHQSSWYRCNQRSESDVYKMAAELPEEEHKTHMVCSCSQASLEMQMYNSHSSHVFKCLSIAGDCPNWIFILPWQWL